MAAKKSQPATAPSAARPAPRRPAAKRSAGRATGTIVLVATRKGAWLFHADAARRSWRCDGPHFLGHTIHHMVLDPRDGRTVLAAARTGHLGPTIFRSNDRGRRWQEATRPPAFPKAPAGQAGRVVDHTFWLTPGHASEPGVWYAGTSPQGLFRSDDGGVRWEPVFDIGADPHFARSTGTGQDGTPNGPKLHSVIVDPRDPAHLYFAMSGGGVHESTDRGRSWRAMVAGLDVVEGFDPANVAFHDPHCMRLCPSDPDRLYQQNHCGIYRIDRPSDTWQRIGRNMPRRIGDIGFPMTVHPRNADVAWVLPMDGSSVWPRTSIDGVPAVYCTRNGGRTWRRSSGGLPERDAWWTVKRQAMAADDGDPVGLYFGTTSGALWSSSDEGDQWRRLAEHLPEIYAVETGRPD